MHRQYTGPKQAEVDAALARWRSVHAEIDRVLTIDDTVKPTTTPQHHHFAIAAAIIGSSMLVALAQAYSPAQNTTRNSKPMSAYDSSAHNNYGAR